MNRPLLLLLLASAASGSLRAQAPAVGSAEDPTFKEGSYILHQQEPTAPKVDTKQVVKASLIVLKDREPEMTTDEYALYQKIADILPVNPQLATTMLTSLVGDNANASPAFQFALGAAYFSADQFDKSEASYLKAIGQYPEFLRAWKNLGALYYKQSRFKDAARCFVKAEGLGDRDPATLGLLGYCAEMQDDLVSAEAAYLQALSLDGANPDWKEGLLRIYTKEKAYGRAAPLAKNLIREHPTEAVRWLDYAGILISDHQTLEAMAVLESARAAGAAGPEELALLGDLYAGQGLYPEAADTYKTLMAASRPRGEEKLLHFADALIESGNLQEADALLGSVHGELTPKAQLALLQEKADLCMAQKRWPEARKAIETLLADSPLDGRALMTLGRALVQENDLPHASFAFDAASRQPGSAYEANLELASIEVRNRHYQKASGFLEKALHLRRSEEVENYLERIRALAPAEGAAG